MAVMSARRCAKLRGAVRYVELGEVGSKKRRGHLSAGTDRIAAMRMDAESVDAFIERGEALAEAHGRKIQARTLVQSFTKSEFDPSDPASVQEVNDLGYSFAKELFPHSDVLVVTHVDGVGGHPHNHVFVLNHDNESGKALQKTNIHYVLSKEHDRFLEERGLAVVERTLSSDQRAFWEQRREGPGVLEFDRQIGDRIEAALIDRRSVDEPSYRRVLAEKGITLTVKEVPVPREKPGPSSIGWTYSMFDSYSEKQRMRRRKASSLSNEFTYKGAQASFEYNASLQHQPAPQLTPHEIGINDGIEGPGAGGVTDHSTGDAVDTRDDRRDEGSDRGEVSTATAEDHTARDEIRELTDRLDAKRQALSARDDDQGAAVTDREPVRDRAGREEDRAPRRDQRERLGRRRVEVRAETRARDEGFDLEL